MTPETIPEDLRACPQWVCHDPAKNPINPHTGGNAKVNDPSTWGTFDQACDALSVGRGVGIGLVLTDGCGLACIDLDDTKGDAALLERHKRIVAAFDSYTEVSPSGNGVHIWIKGRVPGGGVRNSAFKTEAYSSGRYMTVTGNRYAGSGIVERQALLEQLCAELRPHADAEPSEVVECPAPEISDDALKAKAFTKYAEAGRQYEATWRHEGDFDWSRAYQAALMALCEFSADQAQERRVMLASPLVLRAAPKDGETRLHKAERLWGREYRKAAAQGAQERRGRQGVDIDLSSQLARALAPAQAAPASSRLRSARDLQHRHFPAMRWAVPNVLPEGLTIFAGVPKVGKSWFALDVARAKADGDAVLGQECERGDVLLLALEDNERRLQDRLRRVTGNDAWPENLSYATEWPRLDEGGVADIAAWIEGAANPSLVVIDTLAMVKPVPTGRSKSAYDHDVSALKPLHQLASEKRVAIVVVTHTRKAQADEPVERVSSTLGLTGVADTIMLLGRGPKEGTGILYARGRDLAEFEIAVKFENHRWQVEGDPALAFAGDTQKILIEAIAKGATTPKEMEDATGLSGENVRQTLQRMVKQQRVYRHGYGKYALPAWHDRPVFTLDTPHHTSHSHSADLSRYPPSQ